MGSDELEKIGGAWTLFMEQTSPQSAHQLRRYLKTTLPIRGDRFDKPVDTMRGGYYGEKTHLFAHPWGSSNIRFNCPQVGFNEFQSFITIFKSFIEVEEHLIFEEWFSNRGYHHANKSVEYSLGAPDASPFCQYLIGWCVILRFDLR